MMAKEENLSHWMLESARVTVFPLTSERYSNIKDWWVKVTESQPNQVTENINQGEQIIQGSIFADNAFLTLSSQPGRIEWLLTKKLPNDVGDPADGSRFTINTLLAAIDVFLPLVNHWLETDCPLIWRMALGVILQYPVKDRIDGYNKLAEYLKVLKIDALNSSDLMYRINRRKKCVVLTESPIFINNLSTWSVLAISPLMFQLLPTVVMQKQDTEYHACRLELDINTAPTESRNAIPHEKYLDLLNELKESAFNIAICGDQG